MGLVGRDKPLFYLFMPMSRIRDFFKNKWLRFTVAALCYTLWVVWLGSYWWLLGLVIVFDSYITKKVKWAFWKKRYKKGEKHNVWLDWLDALIFALVAATFLKMFFFESYKIPSSSMENSLMTGDYLFVGKLKYGPKVPQTPLTVPLTHNRFLGKESYSTLIRNPYRRMRGYSKVQRFDPVVFNFPNGDTVLAQIPMADYHEQVRFYGKEATVRSYGPLIVRPTDKKDHYVKRCVAVAGDTLQIKDGVLYVNGRREPFIEGVQCGYTVVTDGSKINDKILIKFKISLGEAAFDFRLPGYGSLFMNEKTAARISRLKNVVSVTRNIDAYPPDYPDSSLSLFPYRGTSGAFAWTRDQYGPLWIPRKGVTVPLSPDNLALYARIIRDYEHNDLEVRQDKAYIDGKLCEQYTFTMDYYFMMGDNRHNSLDSRYWGFVPEDHVVGSPAIIWFSIDKYRNFPQNIRWGRLFKTNFN